MSAVRELRLHTPRLVLRPLHAGDAPALLAIHVDPRNTASAKTLERLGFTKEGYLRERWIVGNEVSDTALYGLLAREWQAAR